MTMTRIGLMGLIALGSVACAGEATDCGAAPDALECQAGEGSWIPRLSDAPMSARIAVSGEELSPGSSGDEVHALHEYLTRYGYFPNPELARRYGSWRPLVAEAPLAPDVYDDRTAAAVGELQATLGLPETGLLDDDLRELVRQPRCGVPEGMRHGGRAGGSLQEKYAYPDNLPTNRWDGTAVRWRVVSGGAGLTAAQVTTAANAAFSRWVQVTNITATSTPTGTVETLISFVSNLPSDVYAQAPYPDDPTNEAGGDIRINQNISFSVNGTVGSNQVDLHTVLLHEAGHTLGLDHSSVGAATMRPVLTLGSPRDLTLSIDDTVAVSGIYDVFSLVSNAPFPAGDIGVGPDGSDGDVLPDAWALGPTGITGGLEVRKQATGASWTVATGNRGAQRIAVGPDGIPWIVDTSGNVWKRSTSSATSGTWSQVPGCAKDIGVGGTAASPSVWVTGCTAVTGGFRIFRLNAQGQFVQSTPNSGAGVRIAVDSAGVPWVVASDNTIWRRTSNLVDFGTWEQMPGLASDIGVGPQNYPWIIGGPNDTGNNVYVFNSQLASGTAPQRNPQWIEVPGRGIAVAVGADAQPWVLGTDFKVYSRTQEIISP